MISCERIDKSEGINFEKEGSECMICHYWYFADGLKYQLNVCNECHDFSMTVQNLNDFFILNIKGADYRVYIVNIDNKYAINILNNSNLGDKGVL